METEKKKHKGGYELLKEKYAKLEKERDKLKEQLSMQIAPDFETFKRVERERDEWKAKCDKWKSTADTHLANYDKERYMRYGLEEKVAFLLDHCPFWVRWKYRKQFEKGGN